MCYEHSVEEIKSLHAEGKNAKPLITSISRGKLIEIKRCTLVLNPEKKTEMAPD